MRRNRCPLDPDAIYDALHGAQDQAGVERFGLHGLRHLYCSLLQDFGASGAHAQKRMGHASLTTTLNVYTHAVNEEGRKYAQLVEAAFPFSTRVLEGERQSVQ